MTRHPAFVHPLAGRLGIVNCVHKTKKFNVRWYAKRVNPSAFRIDQIRRTRHYHDIPPNCRGHKDKKLSRVPPANLMAHRQGANHVSYPGEPANNDGSLSMPGALENQPHNPTCQG